MESDQSTSLENKNVLITGASMGIGAAIAKTVAQAGGNLILFARSGGKLKKLASEIKELSPTAHIIYEVVDIRDPKAVEDAVISSAGDIGGRIDILVNNAGLALGAPNAFQDLQIEDILTMNSTNINGLMFTTHAVLNHSMIPNGNLASASGTILNITSVTGLEVPPFSGEAVYHANKAAQEAFTNALRNELSGSNIRVLALRPGVVATHFHEQRIGYDRKLYDEFVEGFEPLVADDVARSALFMLTQPLNSSIKALDVVPTGRGIHVIRYDGAKDMDIEVI